MMLVMLLIPYLIALVSGNQLSRISKAEQRAIEEGPKLSNDLVPLVLSYLDSPLDLAVCSQVSRQWSTAVRMAILSLCGRIETDGTVGPDYNKIQRAEPMRYIIRRFHSEFDQLSQFLNYPEDIVKCGTLKGWARELVSALPYIYEEESIGVSSTIIEELIDIGGFVDVIDQLLALPKDDKWDGTRLAAYAMNHGTSPSLVKNIIGSTSSTALELVLQFYSKSSDIESINEGLQNLESIPLCLLHILCTPETEVAIRAMIKRGIKLEGAARDIRTLIRIFDLGTIGLEIAAHMGTFDTFKADSVVLRAHDLTDLENLDEQYIPLLIHMAFSSGEFGKSFSDSMDYKVFPYNQILKLLERSYYVASHTMLNLLKCSHGISPAYLDRLIEMIHSVPAHSPIGPGELDSDCRVFIELVKHPLITDDQLAKIFEKYSALLSMHPQLGFIILNQMRYIKRNDIAHLFLIIGICYNADDLIERLHSIWDYIYENEPFLLEVDLRLEDIKKENSCHREEIVKSCNDCLMENLNCPLSPHRRHFVQSCILWADINDEKLHELINSAKQLHKELGPNEIFMGYLNAGIDIPENVISDLFDEFPSLYCIILYLSQESEFHDILRDILKHPRFNDNVFGKLILYAIGLAASEKEILILLRLSLEIRKDIQTEILSALVMSSYSETSIFKVLPFLRQASITREAIKAAQDNEWYSVDLTQTLFILSLN